MEKSSSRVNWVLAILLFFNFSIEVHGSYQVPAILCLDIHWLIMGTITISTLLQKLITLPTGLISIKGLLGDFLMEKLQ